MADSGRVHTDDRQLELLQVLESLNTDDDAKKNEQDVGECGVYIHGGVGTGKTYCMDLFYKHFRNKKQRYHFHEFMLSAHERIHAVKLAAGKGEPVKDVLGTVGKGFADESGQLLCLDELQVTDIADAMILKRLFEAIFESGTRVAITSNRPPDQLYLRGLNRHLFLPCIEMLESKCAVFDMYKSIDYRVLNARLEKRAPTGLRSFLYPSWSGETTQQVSQWLDFALEAAGTADAQEGTIRVHVAMGRSWDVDGVKNAYCRLNFADACVEARSSHDFLALASEFPVVVVEEAQAMCAEDAPDVLKRFITLIDTLYDTGCACVVTSTDANTLEDLIPELNFEEESENVPKSNIISDGLESVETLSVSSDGGSSGNSTTMIGQMEWSATGRKGASLKGKAQVTADVRFAQSRAKSRLTEMSSSAYIEAVARRV